MPKFKTTEAKIYFKKYMQKNQLQSELHLSVKDTAKWSENKDYHFHLFYGCQYHHHQLYPFVL